VTRSAFYEGTVRHRRFRVRRHAFRHRIAMAYIDLEELPRLLGGRLVARRPGLVRFRRADYLGDPAVPLDRAVRELVAARLGSAPDGRIGVLTQLRTLGHCFNPVSFYYCHRADGTLHSVVAEVTSTPWSERHAYVLPAPAGGTSRVLHGSLPKRLHVSPFMAMDQRYDWRLTAPAPAHPTLSVHIVNVQDGATAFDATLALRRAPMTPRTLARVVARHPAATLRILALIYAHAAALAVKGVPVHPRRTLSEIS
jgi:DUF1365 family protein